MTARILVVEDEGIAAELIQGVLRNLGHEVCAATAYGEDAVKKALELRPDIILMDIKLRGKMTGLEAAEKIRERLDVPVVYLTAFTDDDTRKRVQMTQPFGYLQKPFRSRELQSAIDIALYRHETERRLKEREEELHRANASLAERKFFFESVITNIQSGILVTDLNMRITLANPYVWRLCNRAADDLIGRHLVEVFPEIEARIAEGVDSDEITMVRGDNELVVGFSRFNLRGFDRAVEGHIINFKNLTEIVKIRREMRQKERLSTMGEVVARVAHEMRNPLFGMTAVGQILDMELSLSPPHKQLMDSFLREAKRLNNLVEELLDSTRELRLNRKEVDFSKVVDASIRVCDVLAREREVRFQVTLPPGALTLQADPEKLEQVVLNLLKNAIEACDPGATIRVVAEGDNNSAILRVIDNGFGIKTDLLDKIFDVFYTTKKSGTGMGLSISRNIAEAHGGSLTACNNAEGGATFTMILPLGGATIHEVSDH